MTSQPDQLTAAEISRLAGVTRATVSNWRRRHPDFPQPSGGSDTSPTYDRRDVEAWLAARNQLPDPSPEDDLRAELRRRVDAPDLTDRLLAWALAANRVGTGGQKWFTELPAADLLREASKAIRSCAPYMPFTGIAWEGGDVAALRVVLRCVRERGAVATLEVLAEFQATDVGVRGTYYTPDRLAGLMAELLWTCNSPQTVLDPACGSGGLLAAAARRGATTLCGQDIMPGQAGQAAARLGVLTPSAAIKVLPGDSLRSDAFPDLAADAVLCNPPFADREWGYDALVYDARWEYGVPPKNESELAWVQHCLAHLEPGGMAILLLPPGVAERTTGREIRTELVRRGALQAVIALPPGAAPPLHIGLQLWLLQRPTTDRPATQTVLFVDTGIQPSKAPDWDSIAETACAAWKSQLDAPDGIDPIPGTARTVAIVDLLADKSADLTPARHVRTAAALIEPDQRAATVHELRTRLQRATSALATLSRGQEWEPAGAQPATWRTATVSDLMRGQALSFHRAASSARSSRSRDHQQQGSRDREDSPVLTAADVTGGRHASGHLAEGPLGELLRVQRGDVLLTEIFQNRPGGVRVVDEKDDGCILGPHVLLFRPDPSRLDPWFLAGFLAAEENLSSAAVGSSIVRIEPRRLRIPLMPLTDQQRYGRAFRKLRALNKAAELTGRLTAETTRQLSTGLTSGSLLPPSADPASSP